MPLLAERLRGELISLQAGAGDRLALQYRMATTEQMHLIIAPRVRIEQTRRRLAKLRAEGLVDRITLPQAGRTRVWFATGYGVQVARSGNIASWSTAKSTP